MDLNLEGRTAVVTGASKGIGFQTALRLAQEGCHVHLVARTHADLEDAASRIVSQVDSSVKVHFHSFDLIQSSNVDAMIDVCDPFDILVNNAGITRENLMRGMSDEEWDDVIATTLTSCFVCCRAAAGIMRRSKYGRIINMASISGLIGNPGQANYSASKAGMIGLTRTLSKELISRGVTVNAVAPGFIASEMTAELGDVVLEEVKKRIPAKRVGSPEDVAAAVLFLASKNAGYVSGQTLVVDGGMIG